MDGKFPGSPAGARGGARFHTLGTMDDGESHSLSGEELMGTLNSCFTSMMRQIADDPTPAEARFSRFGEGGDVGAVRFGWLSSEAFSSGELGGVSLQPGMAGGPRAQQFSDVCCVCGMSLVGRRASLALAVAWRVVVWPLLVCAWVLGFQARAQARA